MTTQKQTFKTWLPIFPGFYGTIFEPDEYFEMEAVNSERQQKGLVNAQDDDFIFDYEGYYQNAIEYCTYWVENQLKDLGFDCSITDPTLLSPREYNFENDSINVDINISLPSLISYLENNFDNFKEYIKERYTSRSGFISHYSNNANVWLTEEIKENPAHCIGAVLDFILQNELNDPEWSMLESIDSNYVYCLNYDELTNPKQ